MIPVFGPLTDPIGPEVRSRLVELYGPTMADRPLTNADAEGLMLAYPDRWFTPTGACPFCSLVGPHRHRVPVKNDSETGGE